MQEGILNRSSEPYLIEQYISIIGKSQATVVLLCGLGENELSFSACELNPFTFRGCHTFRSSPDVTYSSGQ